MKIIEAYDGFYVVQATGDELARCMAFDNEAQRIKTPGQTPFRKGEIVLVEPHQQASVKEGVNHAHPRAEGREFQTT